MIVIPMAGLSSRFFKAGYIKPKYMLELNGEPLFDTCVKSFSSYFESEYFVFIVRDVYDTLDFVNDRLVHLGVKNFRIHVLEQETRGQAETVYLALNQDLNRESAITIFNIDTIRPNFSYPLEFSASTSYLEVFKGEGENWSFVLPSSHNSLDVVKTTEKNPISDLCCTGLYHFSSISEFCAAYEHYLTLPKERWDAGELYVAPLYNYLIEQGRPVKYHVIDRREVIFCGTPAEYESLQTEHSID
ncbi:glycosyltransferase family 2 protein [Aeromonas veronii]